MTDVKRYEYNRPDLDDDADGEWVMYEDYAKLEAENARLQAVVDAAREVVDETLEIMSTFGSDGYKPRNAKWSALVEALDQLRKESDAGTNE